MEERTRQPYRPDKLVSHVSFMLNTYTCNTLSVAGRGVDCHFYHQKKIRKGATARDELLAWAAVICVDDPDYDDLVNAIKNRS